MNTSAGTGARRREEIRRLVRKAPVRSQEELQQLLAERGFAVAQPTLSRDLTLLGLAKTPNGYVDPVAAGGASFVPVESREERWTRHVAESVLSAAVASSLVVLRTPPAAAHAVALALDQAELPGVSGTIAGDDTIFVATPSPAAARRLAARVAALLAPARAVRPVRRPRA